MHRMRIGKFSMIEEVILTLAANVADNFIFIYVFLTIKIENV